ncbi:Aflatoxin biosynthesis regulatory protein [Penicillium concentricum]|uniref:Aflatoxin biosynthesis regulatory protein n=1 Tax=Penicillium concentricum TaxID=293559 RepID=A0A9W9VKP3_9EURO|nr:Aflatoxin biosynthesis regulatory protein [Penicillium concentricum]KAJ5383051.1 Aflatoxin biosynthesis regulatory protein [Penicillium concentricum]
MESTPVAPLPTRPKLRDSCNACSASKVKCNRDKPTCARCAKRGLACEYLVTRRAGRKHDKTRARSSTASSNSPQHPPLCTPEWSVSETPIPTLDYFSQLHSYSDSDQLTSLTGLTVDFDTFLGSPSSFPLLDPSDTLLPSNQSAQGHTNGSYLEASFLFEEEYSSLPIDSLPTTHPNSRDSTNGKTTPDNSSCSCLVKALDLFRQLLPPDSATCTQTHSPSRDQGLTTESIVATNARTVDAITHMLHCLCAHDGFLLVMVFMAAFKVMNWYAAAARGLSSDPQRDVAFAGSLTEDPCRLTAQSVLSELHRVQKLVNALSAKLKRYQPEESTGDGPFSSTVLHQLELDLRQRLRALSLEIVDILRR